jgi:hypothetical protein
MLSGTQITMVVAISYLVVFFSLGSGLINAILEGGRYTRSFVIPTRSAQTIGETIVTTMILFMGMSGALLIYRVGKARTPKSQEALLIAGFAVLAISLTLGFRIVDIKI